MAHPHASRRSRLLALSLGGVMAGMLGMSFAAVPLYRIFCAATGYGGTPKIGPSVSPGIVARPIEVRFNADTHPALPWRFSPTERTARLQLGEERLAFYTATNQADRPITGVATYNVTPDKAAKYFHKTACFCFDQQTLEPGREMQFPLSFYVDPALATDPATADVQTITLSYTFFRSVVDAERAGALDRAGPHVGRRLE
jgi:cytochrome c oxidase assembly protein subunit 11